MSVRKFYLLQCPASLHGRTVEDCHRHAGDVTFALLRQYIWDFHSKWLHDGLREHINVVASQMSKEPGSFQTAVGNPEHCGRCLLHAVCGDLRDHDLLAPIMDARETTCILVLMTKPEYASTFGLVLHSQSRDIRRIQYTPYPLNFYWNISLRGSGLISDVAQQEIWSTSGLWAGIKSLTDLFRKTKRSETKEEACHHSGGRTE